MVGNMVGNEGLLTVDLTAVCHNWLSLQERVGTGCVSAAVVKANAYGLGVDRVAPALYQQGCRQFFVATVNEGIALRAALSADAVIYILDGLRPGAEHHCLQHGLIPVLFTLAQLQRWRVAAAGQQAPCAIKFNSGMNRLGFNSDELEELCADPELLESINPQLFMSHLACADEPAHPLNQHQLQAFNAGLAQIRERLPQIKASLANSSGIFLGPEFHFDLVRPGAALYGINPCPSVVSPMQSVVSLRLPVIQIKVANPGDPVGYGGDYVVNKKSRLAVVLGGYADGLHRAMGGIGAEGKGWLGDVEVPLVGRVSMDSMVFDITSVDESTLPPEGQIYIEMLGTRQNVDRLAMATRTIGYEVLTSLGDRYERRYIE